MSPDKECNYAVKDSVYYINVALMCYNSKSNIKNIFGEEKRGNDFQRIINYATNKWLPSSYTDKVNTLTPSVITAITNSLTSFNNNIDEFCDNEQAYINTIRKKYGLD